MFQRNYVFGADSCTANVINVYAEDLYQPGKGYGFVTEENRREQDNLKIPELNSAFDTVYWYQDENYELNEIALAREQKTWLYKENTQIDETGKFADIEITEAKTWILYGKIK